MPRVTHGLGKSNLWRVWFSMRQRCRLKNHKAYDHYGGRGIKVCEAWEDYAVFYRWAHRNGYQAGLSPDRIDNNGNYEPRNCRWASRKVQNNNKSDNIVITINGRTQTLMQWSEEVEINYFTVWSRIKRGWVAEKAVLTPIAWKRG